MKTRTGTEFEKRLKQLPGLTEIINLDQPLTPAAWSEAVTPTEKENIPITYELHFINKTKAIDASNNLGRFETYLRGLHTAGKIPHVNNINYSINANRLSLTTTNNDLKLLDTYYIPRQRKTTDLNYEEQNQIALTQRIPGTFSLEQVITDHTHYLRIKFEEENTRSANMFFGFIRKYLEDKHIKRAYELSYENNMPNIIQIKPAAPNTAKDVIAILEEAYPATRLLKPLQQSDDYTTQHLRTHEKIHDKELEKKLQQADTLNNAQALTLLNALIDFTETETNRLKFTPKFKKGAADKSKLYAALNTEAKAIKTYLENGHINIADIFRACTTLIKECALVAHHKRYSKWDRAANFFSAGHYRSEPTSWRRWKELCAKHSPTQNADADDTAFTLPSLTQELNCTLDGKIGRAIDIEGKRISDYNSYRKIM